MLKRILHKLSQFSLKYFSNYLGELKKDVAESNLEIVFDLYLGEMVLASIIVFIGSFIGITSFLLFLSIPLPASLIIGAIAAVLSVPVTIVVFHVYPYQKMSSQRSNINANMPFAVNHMAAVMTGGATPYVAFKLLESAKEYGEIAKEASYITRNVDIFGMNISSAIREVAKRTPSRQFKEFLLEIVTTINSGGDLQSFLKHSAEDALFEYRIRREKYLSALSIYADIYTAVLIAAPLFFMTILAVLSMLGGTVFGLNIPLVMKLGIYSVIPIVNIVFLLFIHITQPKV